MRMAGMIGTKRTIRQANSAKDLYSSDCLRRISPSHWRGGRQWGLLRPGLGHGSPGSGIPKAAIRAGAVERHGIQTMGTLGPPHPTGTPWPPEPTVSPVDNLSLHVYRMATPMVDMRYAQDRTPARRGSIGRGPSHPRNEVGHHNHPQSLGIGGGESPARGFRWTSRWDDDRVNQEVAR